MVALPGPTVCKGFGKVKLGEETFFPNKALCPSDGVTVACAVLRLSVVVNRFDEGISKVKVTELVPIVFKGFGIVKCFEAEPLSRGVLCSSDAVVVVIAVADVSGSTVGIPIVKSTVLVDDGALPYAFCEAEITSNEAELLIDDI